MAQVATFGLGWLGDGGTNQRMPLINMVVIYGNDNTALVSICDCSDHISEGVQKDATYIAEMFQENVNEFDPDDRNMKHECHLL